MGSPDLRVAKVREDALLPVRAHAGDAGLDLYALDDATLEPQGSVMLRTGVAMAIPDGHVGIIADRSSMAKRGLKIAGGIIDSGYRGEVHIVLWNLGKNSECVKAGDRVAQLMIVPVVLATPQPVALEDLGGSDRGTKGFGSSGR